MNEKREAACRRILPAFARRVRLPKKSKKIFPKTIDKPERRAIIGVQKENNFHEMLFTHKEGRSDEQVTAVRQINRDTRMGKSAGS